MLYNNNAYGKEMRAFDKLPRNLRSALNYSGYCIDPRYVLGMYTTLGLAHTINYLEALGIGVSHG